MSANPYDSQVYQQLRAMAASYMSGERSNHTLSPTALVHEAYLRMRPTQAEGDRNEQSRSQFFCSAARAMRRILVDSARRKNAVKRGEGKHLITFNEQSMSVVEDDELVLHIDEKLEKCGSSGRNWSGLSNCDSLPG
ncbi:MAG: ECF-type sigma factor [Planctomycetaceae bacterium]